MSKRDIVVKIAGKTFDGWKSLEISQGMDQLCGSFSMKYSDRYINNQRNLFKIGDSCIVDINNHRLITGYIEERESEYTENTHDLQVRGRDKLGDLIDCCHWNTTYTYQQEFDSQSVLKIIKKICDSFGISVVVDSTATAAVAKKVGIDNPFKPNEGDTALDTIIRLCRISALLPVTYGDGRLHLTRGRSDVAVTSLKLGVNIKGGSLKESNMNRYSNYIVKAVQSDKEYEDAPQGKATDASITRHRPLVILSENIADSGTAKTIANWEAITRAGRSKEYQYYYQGWLKEDGYPWSINQKVKIYDPFHKLFNDSLLCTKVVFSIAENDSSMVKMNFMHPDAYKLEAKPESIDDDF